MIFVFVVLSIGSFFRCVLLDAHNLLQELVEEKTRYVFGELGRCPYQFSARADQEAELLAGHAVNGQNGSELNPVRLIGTGNMLHTVNLALIECPVLRRVKIRLVI